MTKKKLILFGIFLKQVPRIQVGVSEVLGPKNLDGNLNKVAWKGLRWKIKGKRKFLNTMKTTKYVLKDMA